MPCKTVSKKRNKRILFYGPPRSRSTVLFSELCRAGSADIASAHDPTEARHILEREYVHLLVIDLREAPESGLDLLERLDDVDDVEARYGFHRIIALIPATHSQRADQLLVDLGAHGVRKTLREGQDESAKSFARRIEEAALDLIAHRHKGQRALCAAGGGVTGIYFELGALKCLDDCLPAGAISSFDMYFGISAGAVVTSMIANGFSPDEIMASVAGVDGGRIRRLDFRLTRLGHLNSRGLTRHLQNGTVGALRHLWDMVRRRNGANGSSLFTELADAISPPFHSSTFEKMLREILESPGATNDFHELPHSLFVGATDQDARQHTLFGSKKHERIPISRAVRASLSVNPAFASVSIGGRYYEDGAVTRTSNFTEAIRRNATLVFIVDPFVPYVSKEAGLSRSRGLLYNADQNIRTISYTRFENARNWVLRKHPEVSSYTFLPSNTLRRLLSLNPMDHRPYLEIWRGAYLSTLQRIHHLAHRMRGDLRAYGLPLDTSRADAVAERLRATHALTFADFFPDGRADISQPTLALERRRVTERTAFAAVEA